MTDGANTPQYDSADGGRSTLTMHKRRNYDRKGIKKDLINDRSESTNGFESAAGQLSAMQRRISCLENMIKNWATKEYLGGVIPSACDMRDPSDDSLTAVDDSSIEITTLDDLERHFSGAFHNNRDSSSIISSIFDAYMPDSEPHSPVTPEFDDEIVENAIEHIDYEVQQLQIKKYDRVPSLPPRAADHNLKAHHHVRFNTTEASTFYVDLRPPHLDHKGHHHLNAHRVRDSVTLRKSQMIYVSETEHDLACLNALSNAGVTKSGYSSRIVHYDPMF